MDAPQAFRKQERAVPEADYAAAAERHPGVQRAAATYRWTGSWQTVYVTVDRKDGLTVDAAFEEELEAFIDRFSLAGYDIEIEPPRFVPIDLAFTVCVAPGHVNADVKRALLDVFSNRIRSDGTRGFFHPDEFTFGQPLYLSRVVATAMSVPGVQSIDTDDTAPKPNRFRRWGEPSRGESASGRILPARLEILRLDNDPNSPGNGRIELFMEGGL
jgi:predicted phage baseplate assembly protein